MKPLLSAEDPFTTDLAGQPRYTCDPPQLVHLLARPKFERLAAYLCDFSVCSIGIVTDRGFDIDTLLVVEFHRGQVGLSGVLTARVRCQRQLSNGRWFVGCSLSRNLTAEEQRGFRGG
jgi:hypothetical protein